MTQNPVSTSRKRTFCAYILLMQLVYVTAAASSEPQLLQANQNEEKRQAQLEQDSESTLIDVIKENQSKVDYIHFDLFTTLSSSICFNYEIGKPLFYEYSTYSRYHYALTYERFRLYNAVIDSALNATSEELIEALNASNELTVQGQALLMLALHKYESAYRQRIVGRGNNVEALCEKRLTQENWKRYEDYLKEHLKSKEIVYEPLVRSAEDRNALLVQWHNSLRWNYANMILLHPERWDYDPLEAYALKVCQEEDITHVRFGLHRYAIKPGQGLLRKQRIYSNLGQSPTVPSHAPLDINYERYGITDNSDEIQTKQDDPWSYNPANVKKITGDEAWNKYRYMPKYLLYLQLEDRLIVVNEPWIERDDRTCELQVTLGDIARVLLIARKPFQTQADFDKFIVPLLQESE